MKKVLFASTALVLSAGVAAAEVTVGGDGRMGIVYSEGAANEFEFNSRIRISFAASGETDGGLAFGGSIRADNAVGGAAGTAGSVFISGDFGKLTMGDVDSGGKAAVGQVSGVGYTGIGDLNEITYLSTPVDEAALYEYSFGAATFYASLDQINNDETAFGLGVKYDAGTFTVSLGYEDVEDTGNHIIVGATTDFGPATLKAVYGTFDGDAGGPLADFNQYAISVDYTTGMMVFTGFIQSDDTDGVANDADLNWGLGASYDLGGGAALKGGIAHDGDAAGGADMVADFGITMSF